MIKERVWPVRLMYLLIAAALAISMIIVAAPSLKVSAANNNCADAPAAKWSRVSTPTEAEWLLAPCSTIVDFAVADGGDVAYAIVYSDVYDDCPHCVGCAGGEEIGPWYLLKSTDGAATWKDITKGIKTVIDKKFAGKSITSLVQIATDGVDPDYVAVALTINGDLYVFTSNDGGSTFKDLPKIDKITSTSVVDLEVSLPVDGVRDIAISGSNSTAGKILRLGEYGWEDTSKGDYTGWLACDLVADIRFSPNWELDKTIVAVTANSTDVYLQTGTWGESPVWKNKAIVTGKTIPGSLPAGATAGVTLPSDYSGTKAETRWLWVWVNYQDGSTKVGEIYYVKGDFKALVGMQIEGKPWLTNVSYWGTRAEGKAIAALLGDGAGKSTACCAGVDVYRIDSIVNMDLCGTCEPWLKSCKPPTGRYIMAVAYVRADKAYAVATHGIFCYDEGAWSVSFDDGDTWNQLSLIDTKIDYLSDVAVSPDCNKTFLVSVNLGDDYYEKIQQRPQQECGCGCDSVWVHANTFPEAGYEEYSGHWLRSFCFRLTGNNTGDFPNYPERGLLRLAPEETDGMTVYLVDRMSKLVYWNEMETLACWENDLECGLPKLTNIVDLAVKDKKTIYALSSDGQVAMADQYGCSWKKPVDSLVCGWTIAVHGDYVLVGDDQGRVSYSDDGGATFTRIEKATPIVGRVTVAFDTYFDQNDAIYAAVDALGAHNYCGGVPDLSERGGIYSWVIDESTGWQDLSAGNYAFTGLVLDRPSPANPMTSPKTGGVLYASYIDGYNCYGGEGCIDSGCTLTGVARSLNPLETEACRICVDWDYLIVPLTYNELFTMAPHALKICGCLEPTSDSKLFAIDGRSFNATPQEQTRIPCRPGTCPFYDMCEGKDGTVWTFTDCYAKKAPEVTVPALVPADPCSCYNAPFTVTWGCVCDACHYELEFATDEEFTSVIGPGGWVRGTSYLAEGGEEGEGLSCEMDYYVRVRAVEAGTCQEIRSWWSEPKKFTVAPSVGAAAITLVAPAPGALNQPTKNLGFSWTLLAAADKFDWVLSKNADLSSSTDSKQGFSGTAVTCTKTLDYGTTYYWQVTAYKGGTVIARSAIGTFTTAPKECAYRCAQCGVCFDTQADLEKHYKDVHQITPFWVWVLIAIGAVLVIVVIVLIFRTRRV